MEKPRSGFVANLFSALLRLLLHRLDKPSLPKYQGKLFIPGLRDKVDVVWGSHGVPHVFAANERDLFIAQGYLHAQERLWQMEMSRRFLSGRLAEIFGSFAVPWKELSSHFRGSHTADLDYFIRLVGIRGAALASMEVLAGPDGERLQAYSDGVNRYIERCGTKLPWEFRVLRYQPEPWQPQDCLTIGKGFALLVSPTLFTRFNMIALATQLSDRPETFRSLLPSYPEDSPTITRAIWDSARGLWRFMNGTLAVNGWSPAGHGSNSWVVAPSHSATGNAILCNDPHLHIMLPSIWYLMYLKAEPEPNQPDGFEALGASIPGSPCITIGHNRWIAWGITAALCDDVEIYREKIHPLEPNRYLVGHKWLTTKNWDEQIRVRGRGEINRMVRSTIHGPIISDFGPTHPSGENLSLRWTAHEPSQDFHCLYGINRARSWPEFLNSLSYQAAPTLNYLFADHQGNIGYSLAGKIPKRSQAPSLLPLDGWNESNEWKGYIPFDELPRTYNPPDGVIATANHRVVDASYPYYVSYFFEPPYRIERIRELLGSKESFSIDDMAGIQMDTLSLHAKDCINTLRADLVRLKSDDPRVSEAADRLLRWDGTCQEASVEASLFHVFHHRLMANLLVPALGKEFFHTYVEIFNQCLMPIAQILSAPNSPWFSAQPRRETVARALQESCKELEQAIGADMASWQWGRIHTLTLSHALGRVKLLRPALSIGPFQTPGDGVTINMGFYRHSTPYQHAVGASLRCIIDVGRWDQSSFILPSGQSGHLSSPYYQDQTDLWRKGKSIRIHFNHEDADARSRLILEPGSSAKP
jgi:penicillin G amidase